MKLHLPKMLLTAIIAAAACFQQVQAEETQAADNANYSVYGGYQYTIVNWQGGSSGTASGYNKAYGICYAGTNYVGYRKANYNAETQSFDIATATDNDINHWNKTITSDSFRTLLFDSNSPSETNDNVRGRVFYDINNVKLSGFIVTADSSVNLLQANSTSSRGMTLGKAGGTTGYTTLAKDFTLDLNSNSLSLEGTQVWNLANDATYTIKNTGSFTNVANLTVNGGTLSITNTLTNTGSLSLNNTTVKIATLDGFDAGSFLGIDYNAAENGVQQAQTSKVIITGSGTSNLSSVVYNDNTVTLTDGMLADDDINVYVVTSGSATVGGNSATDGTAAVDGFAVGSKGTLNIAGNTDKLTSSQILLTTSGKGKLVLGTEAGIANGQSTMFEGTLEIATGGTLKFGQAKTAVSDMSSLASVVLDGGTLEYHASGSTINNLAVTQNGGTFKILDQDNSGNNIPAIQLNGTTAVNGDLSVNMTYKSRLEVEHLTGTGKLTLNSASANDDGFGTIANISSMSGFSGTLDLAGKANNKVTVNATLDTGYTLNASQITMNNAAVCTVNLTGSGTYNLGTVNKNATVSSLTANDSSVKLADGWSGTVKLSGGVANASNDNSKSVKDINFNNLGVAGSTVEIAGDGLYGYLEGNSNTYNPNIKLTGNLVLQNGYSGKDYTFNGTISGKGNIEYRRGNGSDVTNGFTFNKSLENWQGAFVQAGDSTSNVTITGAATTVNAAFLKETGDLNLTVNNSGKTTTFSKEVKVDKLTITDGSTMTITATETSEGQRAVGDSKLSANSIEFGKDAKLNVTGSITLDASSISLKSGMTFTSASDVTLMTVTNGTLTVTNVDSWTGGSMYEIDGRAYTTSLSVDNNTLQLKFTAEPLDSMDVYITLNGCSYDSDSDMLELVMVDANGELINDISQYYNVVGIYGDASWDDVRDLVSGDALVGITLVGAGAPVVGDGESNVGFYGTYKGEGNGQYTDTQSIPEPATATLSLLALAGLAARRRRK